MATILPLGKTQFCDALGNPLAGGSVYFYIPNTTTPKDTWQDADQTVLNSNPVVLDSAGEAVIYGSGSYRQIVKDADGNLIWDQQTSEASSGQQSFGGTSTGTANAQVVSAGTFNATDGSVITFIAGLSNTGAMTLQVGSASAVAVYKNSGSGPVDLASGDIVSGNIYSVVYSVNLAAFQLLQSIPPTITIASEAEAEAGTNNTNLMTPLRTNQAIQALTPAPTIATQAQAETGTDNTVYMTPLRSAEAIGALATPAPYTGTDVNNLNFPIGSCLFVDDASGINRNAQVTLWLNAGDGTKFSSAASGTALQGTWAARGNGQFGSGGRATLFQRIA